MKPAAPTKSTAPRRARTIYYIEAMVSAGPRKSRDVYADPTYRELGEDAAGVLAHPNRTLFWMADGTSTEPVFREFSSRTLAQDAGTAFTRAANSIVRQSRSPSLSALADLTLQELLDQWQHRMETRWHKLLSNGEADGFLAQMALCGDGLRRVSWSSTLTIGFIEHRSRRLSGLSLGNTRFVVQRSDGLAEIAPYASHGLWVGLTAIPGTKDVPRFNVVPDRIQPSDVVTYRDVTAFTVLTDGHSSLDLETIFETHRGRGVLELSGLIRRLHEKSYDDRALLVGIQLDVF